MNRQAKESGSCFAGLALMLVLSYPVASAADVDREPLSGLTVEAAHVVVQPGMDTGRVSFRLDNYGTRTLTLTGVRSPLACDGVLMMRHPGLGNLATGMLIVPRNETLHLDTNHLQVELRGFVRPLVPGETIPLRLEFRSGAVETDAHVHSYSQRESEDSSQPQSDEGGRSLSDRNGAAHRYVMNAMN